MQTILIADDYPVSVRVLSHQLTKAGYDVVTATDGEEALEMLEDYAVDLAIIDLNMPHLDGLAVLDFVRSDERFTDLPVIILTASGQDEDRIEAKARGATGFLTKPASSQEVVSAVVSLLPAQP